MLLLHVRTYSQDTTQEESMLTMQQGKKEGKKDVEFQCNSWKLFSFFYDHILPKNHYSISYNMQLKIHTLMKIFVEFKQGGKR